MYYYKLNYMIGSLLTIAITLILGTLILIRGRGGKLVRLYFLLMFAIAVFSFGMYMFLVSESANIAFFWVKALNLGVVFIPVLYFHFCARLVNVEDKEKNLLRIGYALAIIFAGLFFTPLFIKSISPRLGMFFIDPGPLYPMFIIFFLSFPMYAYYMLFTKYNTLTDLAKRQVMFISIAGLSGFLGGVLVFFTVYGVNIPILGPSAIYLIAFTNLSVAIATYTVRLMDVELIQRRTLIFSLLYGVTVGIFVALVFIGHKALSAAFHINRWVIPAMALFIITVFIRPLENLLIKLTDKVLYQRRYDYMDTLKRVAKGMAVVTDSEKLLKLIIRFISKEIRVTGCAIYVYSKDKQAYIKKACRGFKWECLPDDISKDSSFSQWFIEKKQPLNYENLLSWIQSERIFPQKVILKKTLDQIRVTMFKLNASICVPSSLRGEMIGFLVLGAKLSGAKYTADDISLLSTLANSAAIALENAHMYEELKKRIATLKQLYEEEHNLFMDAASAFSYAIDAKDGYTHTHGMKVSVYAVDIARELEKMQPYIHFDENFYETLKIASLLHDVGKIGISDKILNKAGKLTEQERDELKEHTSIGAAILHPIKEIKGVFDPIRYHHENFDGTGYPEGLSGTQIPNMARIIAVANAFDSMISERPHRAPMGKQEAIDEITKRAGTQFDPAVVEAFSKIAHTF